MVDTNEGFATTQTNFFFETDSGIFSGDSALWQGNFDCGESFIDKAGPGEDLNDVIAHFDRLENIFIGTFWTVPLRDYFRDEFFARFGFEGSTQIQSERIVRGRLELDFNSYRYETKGSVWLDLGTFVVRDAVEYRPIRFDTVSLLWGLAPALAAVLTLLWTAFIVRKARKPIHYVISGMVLAMEADALHLLYEMYIVGAWSDYFFIFRHFFVPGEWSAYLPMAYVGCAFLITSMQALLLYNHKRS
ncbi:MAG TPA: hypothetical protein VK811_03925 [Candidatus Acidoferrum sp.]|nr:hypothetical protein [Candidatus Acidoferrum sp.]